MTRYIYNQQLVPPAPLVPVGVSNPQRTGEGVESPALLDTAADRTVIPQELVESLHLLTVRYLSVAGLGGRETRLPDFVIRLAVRQAPPLTIELVACPGEPFVLLGRDVLNQFRIVLDGPQLSLEIH